MKKLAVLVPAVFVVIFMASYFTYSSYSKPQSQTNGESATVEQNIEVNADWQASFKKVSDYFTPPPKEKPKTKPKRKKRVWSIKDGTLVGVVTEPSAKALIVVRNQPNIREVPLGEGWLAPWRLKRAENDNVLWVNQKTKEEFTQYLFK